MKTNEQVETQIPVHAVLLASNEEAEFSFSEASSEGGKSKKPRFRMIANSGGVIENHPYWGNFAIDLDGLQVGRRRIPTLRDHDSQRIVGWTHSIEKSDEGLVVEGTFAESTPDGREVLDMLKDGFPWQASVYVPPKKIQKVGDGESVDVNGHTLHGPGHVFRESSLREVTFTALGADENTEAAQLSSGNNKIMALVYSESPERMEVPVSEQEKQAPEEAVLSDLPLPDVAPVSDEAETSVDKCGNEGYDEGVRYERERISAILSHALENQRDLALDLVSRGVEKSDAFSALLQDARGQVEAKLAHLSQSTLEPVGADEKSEDQTDLRSAFAANPELAEEFGTFEIYEAYTKAKSEGMIRPGKGDK